MLLPPRRDRRAPLALLRGSGLLRPGALRRRFFDLGAARVDVRRARGRARALLIGARARALVQRARVVELRREGRLLAPQVARMRDDLSRRGGLDATPQRVRRCAEACDLGRVDLVVEANDGTK